MELRQLTYFLAAAQTQNFRKAAELCFVTQPALSRQIALLPQSQPHNGNWHPGDAPSQVSQWAVQAVAKAGTISIIGVYPPAAKSYPIGMAMNKNVRLNMGNCNHRKYLPMLIELVQSGVVEPLGVLTQTKDTDDAINAYQAFDRREAGWTKVELVASR